MNEARYGHACGNVGQTRILVAGGKDDIGNSLDSTETFSLYSLEWSYAAPLPNALSSVASFQHQTTVIILGKDIYHYDETSDKWPVAEI